jgi:uncharacterized protein (TIGR02996 family)
VIQEDAFLAAVLADPDDDAPRLIYADWLDEHGLGKRAELIRVQIALAGLGSKDERRTELRRRERRLLRRHATHWAAPLGPVWEYSFHRGFVESVTYGASLFLSRGADLFTHAPIRSLRLLNAHQWALPLSQCPYLSRPIALGLHNTWLNDRDAHYLANSAFLRPLTGLNLAHNRISEEGAISLARSPYLGSLDDLDLRGNDIPHPARAELRRRFGSRVHF